MLKGDIHKALPRRTMATNSLFLEGHSAREVAEPYVTVSPSELVSTLACHQDLRWGERVPYSDGRGMKFEW